MRAESSPQHARHDIPLALLVDRDLDTRQMYAEFLRQSAFEIEEAEDGREALAKCIAHQPDIVVTETRLPGLDGFELCDLLRKDPATRDIPILCVPAAAYAEQIRRAEASGADVVLVKPCLPETVRGEIQRLLNLTIDLRERARVTRDRWLPSLSRST